MSGLSGLSGMSGQPAIFGIKPFSPADIDGLLLWLDTSDISTLWIDSAGTNPVTADGDVIGKEDDKSLSGNNAIQTTTADKAVYKTAIQNSLSVSRYDGIDDYHTVPVIDLSSANVTASVFIVTARNGVHTGYTLTQFSNASGLLAQAGFALLHITDELRLYLGGTQNTLIANEDDNFKLIEAVLDRSGTSYAGINGSVNVVNWGAATDNAAQILIGARTQSSPAVFFSGDIGEILIYNSALSGSDRLSVENYLNDKWNLY